MSEGEKLKGEFKVAFEAEIGGDRMAMGLPCIPDGVRGDMEEVARLRTHCEQMEKVLKEYADLNNWGYYDEGGCRKGIGIYTEACFIGPELAKCILAGLIRSAEPTGAGGAEC